MDSMIETTMAENSCALNDQNFRENILQQDESLQSYLASQPTLETGTPADSIKDEERLLAELDEDDDQLSFIGSDDGDLSDLISDKEMIDESPSSNSNPPNALPENQETNDGSIKSNISGNKESSNDGEECGELSETSDESDGEKEDAEDEEELEEEEEEEDDGNDDGDDDEEEDTDADVCYDGIENERVKEGDKVKLSMDTDKPNEKLEENEGEPVITASTSMTEPSKDQDSASFQKSTEEAVEMVGQKEKGTSKKRVRDTEGGSKKKRKVMKDKQRKQRSKKKNAGSKKGKTRKSAHERKNIRDILKDNELEEETVAAQAAELERRQRLMDLKGPSFDVKATEVEETPGLPEKDSELRSLLQAAEAEASSSDDIILVESEEEKKMAAPKPPTPVTQHDVITLSSDDDEDDITMKSGSQESVVSRLDDDDEDEEECTAQEEDDHVADDPNDSGFHINDAENLPDFEGRVLVNVKHPSDDHDIYLAPQIARVIKPHQIGGIRFLYDNLVESLSRFRSSAGFGCILAHSMGLGKTIQLVAFIDVFLRETAAKTVLCIVPINTLQNWMSEFNMWLPTDGADNLRPGDRPRNHKVYLLNDGHKTMSARANVIENWCVTGGVLLMGYEMYRLLCSRKNPIYQKPKKQKKCAKPEIIDLEEEDRNKMLLVDIQSALVRPGPDLVVCDEGHRIKNSHAGISQSLKNIRTKRRVVLTGYPLQNNLLEYWCMVDFVRPNYLGSKTEFCNMFERPIMNGQCMDSTVKDIKIMRYRAHVLHSLLEGFVQRRGHTVLRYNLPPKQEFVFLVKLSPIQRAVYKQFMECIESGTVASWETTNPLKAFSVCCKIWNHPDVLHKVLAHKRLSAAEDNDLDIDTEAKSNGEAVKTKKRKRVNNLPSDESYGEKNVISYDWAEPVMKDYTEGLLENGAKVMLLFEILEKTLSLGEKMLVFSQSLFTLNIIEEFLTKQKVSRPHMDEYWCRNKNYFRLDGATAGTDREKLINQFNAPDNDRVWLFLLSTRAGSLGINLIGANRVVVMDASWNPCHDCQAVCRVYRYGQQKNCYVYRLVSENTLEKKIYERQINKQGMSDRVVDELNPDNNFTRGQVESLLHFEDKDFPPVDISKVDETYDDEVLLHTVKKHTQWITQLPFTHESLLIDKKELRLSKQEKRLAKQSYAMEKKLNVSYSRPSYAAYYPKYGQGNRFNPRMASAKHTRPIASVKPIMSTPVPPQAHPVLGPSGQSTFPLQQLVRPGVSVHQVITTTDIVLPGSNTPSSARPVNRIPAGQNVLVIKTTKGVYIRTSDGKIFAVRSRADQQSIQKEISEQTASANRQVTTPTTTSSTAGNINPLVGMAKQVERTLKNRGDPSASKNSDLLANIYAQTATVNSLLNKKPLEMDRSSKRHSPETPSTSAALMQPSRQSTKVVTPVTTTTGSSNMSEVKPFEAQGSPKTFTSNSSLSNSLFDSDTSSMSESLSSSSVGNMSSSFGNRMPPNSIGDSFGGNPTPYDNNMSSDCLRENFRRTPLSFDSKIQSNSNQTRHLNLVAPFKSNVPSDGNLSGTQNWPVKPFESEETGKNARTSNIVMQQLSQTSQGPQVPQTVTTTTQNSFPLNRRFDTEWPSGITSSPSDISRESHELDFDSRSLVDVDKVLRVSPQRAGSDFLSDSQDSQSSERSQDLSSSTSYNMPSYESNQGYNAPLPSFTPITSSVPYNNPLTSSMMMSSLPDFSTFPSMSSYPIPRNYGQYPMPSYPPYPVPHPMLIPQPNMDMPSDSYHHYGHSKPISQHTVNMNTLSGSNVLSLPSYRNSPVSDILSVPPSHHKSSSSSSSNLPVSQDNTMM